MTDTTITAPRPVPARPARATAWALVVSVVSLVLGADFSWVPSFSFDESVSAVVARGSWQNLGTTIEHVDLVHAAYYVLLHAWTDLAGTSPAALRFPSAVAVAATTFVVFRIGCLLVDRRTGLLASAVFAVLPRATEMGLEARSRAFLTLLAAAVVLSFLRAEASDAGPRRVAAWCTYAGLAIVSVVVNIYDVLVIAALGVFLLWRVLTRRSTVRDHRTWSAVTAVVGAVVVPFVSAVVSQREQVAWLPDLALGDVPRLVLVSQWFPAAPLVSLVVWPLVALGAWRATRTGHRDALVLLGAWLVVPFAVLMAVTLVGPTVYGPRYVVMSTPALALLAAAGLDAVRGRLRIVLGLTLLLVCAPQWAVQRFDDGRSDQRSDWVDAAADLAGLRAGRVDGAVIYGDGPLEYQQVSVQDPTATAGLVDLSRSAVPPEGLSWFYPEHVPPEIAAARAAGHPFVVFVGDAHDLPALTRSLASRGFSLTDREAFDARYGGETGVVALFED